MKGRTTLEVFSRLAEQHADAIVFILVGDFFETFGADALEVSTILGIPTQDVHLGGKDVAMCGFMQSRTEENVARLIKAGRKVTLAEPTHGVD